MDISAANDEASITLFMVHGVCILGAGRSPVTMNMSTKKKAFNTGHEREEHDKRVSIGTKSHCCCY